MKVHVSSEIGSLTDVIVHSPGAEVENMTPQNAERALYSDILNLNIVRTEYAQFKAVLNAFCQTYEVRQLLQESLAVDGVREILLNEICLNEHIEPMRDYLSELADEDLTRQLIEGVPLEKNSLTTFLSPERYTLQPLHNFFFTRDTAFVVNDMTFISCLGTDVREREALIMDIIFTHHPQLKTNTINPGLAGKNRRLVMEGGDFLIIRDDVLLAGIGSRTNSLGVDFIIKQFNPEQKIRHIIAQQLPLTPESFIHLDMVFTMLDTDVFMIYEPVVLSKHDYQTIHIELDHGKIKAIREVKNIPEVLNTLGIDGDYIHCGGRKDVWIQEREQWHSGANFFALGPGKILGYQRNIYTLEALSKNGFEIIHASDVLSNNRNVNQMRKCVITIEGSELARGGGGCRCMTLPIARKNLPI